MKLNVSKICRIANVITDDMIADKTEFLSCAEDDLSEVMDYLGIRNGFSVYHADTNGNDEAYILALFVNEEGVKYADAVYDKENGFELDDSHLYPYSDFPFSAKELKEWIEKKVADGVKFGQEEIAKPKIFQEQLRELEVGGGYVESPNGELIDKRDIPDWSLPYLVNGDDDSLSDEDKKIVDNWRKNNGIILVNPIRDNYECNFTGSPEFGDPCDCCECYVHFKKEVR